MNSSYSTNDLIISNIIRKADNNKDPNRYGMSNTHMPMTGNIWKEIIKYLPEAYWYKLIRLNSAFYSFVKKNCNDEKNIKSLILEDKFESVLKILLSKI